MGNDEVSRRKFLEHAGAALGTAALGAACGSNGEGNETRPDSGVGASGGADGDAASSGAGGAGSPGSGGAGSPGGAPSSGGASSGGTSSGGAPGSDGGSPAGVTVAIVSRANLDEAVLRAVELAGGIDAIQPGQTVFIKPNAVSDRAVGTAGIRTSPEVLAAVVRLVKTRNPGRIVVGDRSARTFPDTVRVFQTTGLGDAALAAGADEVYGARSPLDAPDEWVLLQPARYEETWAAAGGILAMRRIVEADHLINVPTCKDHRYALFSLSMKNFIGAIGDSSRDPIHYQSTFSGNFDTIGRDIAILNQMFSPLLNIVDATTVLVNGGPEGSGADAVRSTRGLILASRDRVALDALGVSLIKHELASATVPTPDAANPVLLRDSPWQLPQIVNAIERSIGVGGPRAVTLAFDGVADSAAIEAVFRA